MTNFPTLFDWIERLDFLRGMPATYLLLLAGLVVVAIWEWRFSLLALSLQYLLATLLFIEVLEPRLAIVKLFVGLFVCLMLYFTARQANAPSRPDSPPLTRSPASPPWDRFAARLTPDSMPFRLFLAILLIFVLFSLARRPGNQLPAVPVFINLAVYGLSGLGLLGLALTSNPLRAGMALLMVMLGFELFYNSLEQSVLMLVVLATINLVIAIAIAYLAQAGRSNANRAGDADDSERLQRPGVS